MNYREPLIFPEGGGDPEVRNSKTELAGLQAEFEECGEWGWEGLRPVKTGSYAMLAAGVTLFQSIMRSPDDPESVVEFERGLYWQLWFHTRMRMYEFTSAREAKARQVVLEKTGRDDIDLEPCSEYRFWFMRGSLYAVRWSLGQEWRHISLSF